MTTAVDTSALLDAFLADPTHLAGSLAALRSCAAEGELVACDVVWGEVSAVFPSAEAAREAMERIDVRLSPMTIDAALAAGSAWREYRRRGGGRHRIIADFLIGGHALVQADRLLTWDRGHYRSYFEGLVVLDPSRDRALSRPRRPSPGGAQRARRRRDTAHLARCPSVAYATAGSTGTPHRAGIGLSTARRPLTPARARAGVAAAEIPPERIHGHASPLVVGPLSTRRRRPVTLLAAPPWDPGGPPAGQGPSSRGRRRRGGRWPRPRR